jgi:hypothetical protein
MLLLAIAGVVAIAGACGADATVKADSTDSGTTTGAVGDGICPAAPPALGDGCLLPEGTTCSFGECGSSIAQCLGGLWRYSGNPAPQPVCPDPEPPASDTACPPCWPATGICRYGSDDCSSPDASANRTVATCPSGVWRLQYTPCALPVDAGPDVQGDAGADAD